jgi:hypothetical protein
MTYQVPPGTGTVTSVGLTMPSDFAVASSPVTGSGTLAVTYSTQTATYFLGGPTSGAAATPTYRAIGNPDLACLQSVRAFNSGNQTLTDTVGAVLTLDSETWDTASLHSTSTNTGRLTAAVAGRYIVNGSCVFAANANGWRMLRIRKNGTTYYSSFRVNALADATAGVHADVTAMVDLAASDYVELVATEVSGINLNVSTAAFGMFLIGP